MNQNEYRTANRSYTRKGPGRMPHRRSDKPGSRKLPRQNEAINWKGDVVESYVTMDAAIRRDFEKRSAERGAS